MTWLMWIALSQGEGPALVCGFASADRDVVILVDVANARNKSYYSLFILSEGSPGYAQGALQSCDQQRRAMRHA